MTLAAVYWDLLRQNSAGTGEGLVAAYFQLAGWPTFLPTSEREIFVQRLVEAKARHLLAAAARGEVPLRPGALEFVDDALAAGAAVVVLTGTASDPGDSVVSSAMLQLGPARAAALTVVSASGRGARDFGAAAAAPLGLDALAADAQRRAKATVAASLAEAMNARNPEGLGVGVDPCLLRGRAGALSAALFASLVAGAGAAPARSAAVAAGHSAMEAARGAGLLVAGVPPSFAARGSFAAADAAFDGFGSGSGLSWRRLAAMLEAREAAGGGT
jgi:hypothetical protein